MHAKFKYCQECFTLHNSPTLGPHFSWHHIHNRYLDQQLKRDLPKFNDHCFKVLIFKNLFKYFQALLDKNVDLTLSWLKKDIFPLNFTFSLQSPTLSWEMSFSISPFPPKSFRQVLCKVLLEKSSFTCWTISCL